MKKRLILMLAVLLVAQPAGTRRALAAAEAPGKAQAQFNASTVLPVCEQALRAAMAGKSTAPVLEQGFKALTPDQRETAMVVCQIYILGAVSIAEAHERAARGAGRGHDDMTAPPVAALLLAALAIRWVGVRLAILAITLKVQNP